MSSVLTLQYQAQTPQGSCIRGTLEAMDVQTAREQLLSLGLTVMQLEPVKTPALHWPTRAVSSMDLQLFNQQLVNLTQAGLPVEQGLRLIAREIHSRPLRKATEQVIGELDKGRPLAQAFDSQRKHFPRMYAHIIDAGARSGRLPGVLSNLGQHLQLMGHLKTTLYRACAYPTILLLFFLSIMGLMAWFVAPMPSLTLYVFTFFKAMTVILPVMLMALVLFVLSLGMLRLTPWWNYLVDGLMNYLPLVGPVLRRNAIARWCDAVRMGVDVSMDLPGAMQLAQDMLCSPTLARDTQKLIDVQQQGRPFSTVAHLSILPPTVLSAIELAENAQSLSSSLEDLASMYRQQAYMRSLSMENVICPVMMVGIGGMVGITVLAMFLPLLRTMTYLN
jgi:type IV pilus assembly protein PilC